jgi:hypothetical protein
VESKLGTLTLLDWCSRFVSYARMTLILRKQTAQDRVEGREPGHWKDDDYAVAEDTVIGRIYKEKTPGGEWQWFFQLRPAPPPTKGITGTLDEAKAEIAKAYERYQEAKSPPPHSN